MSSRFLNTAGAAAIAAMLGLFCADPRHAQITFPWSVRSKALRRSRGSPTTPNLEMRIQRWKTSSGN